MSDTLIKMPRPTLYVVRFDDNCVKVGFTTRPWAMRSRYDGDAKRGGRVVTDLWLSDPHVEARDNERDLKRWCDERGVCRNRVTAKDGSYVTGEYFDDLVFNDVVSYATTLPQTPWCPPTERRDEVVFNYETGVATLSIGDTVMNIDMTEPTWLARLSLAVVSGGGNVQGFMTEVIMPHFASLARRISLSMRE